MEAETILKEGEEEQEEVSIRAIDLELLVGGVPMIDVGDWREHCEGSLVQDLPRMLAEIMRDSSLPPPPPPPPPQPSDGEKEREARLRYTLYSCRELAEWFWEVLEEMGPADRAKVRKLGRLCWLVGWIGR